MGMMFLRYKHGTVITDTYANILALATAGNLKYDTLYQINDNTDAEGGDILLSPSSTSTFFPQGLYIPSGDNTQEWECYYAFDSQQLEELRDNQGNVVSGNTAINNFLWLDNNVTNNIIENPFVFNMPSGGFYDGNVVGSQAIFNVTLNSGSINYNTIQGTFICANNNGGDITSNVVHPSGTLNIVTSNTGSIAFNVINRSQMIITNNTSTIWDNEVTTNGRITIVSNNGAVSMNLIHASFMTITSNAGMVQQNFLSGNSTMTVTTNDANEIGRNILSGNAIVSISKGTGQVTRLEVSSASTVTINNAATATDVSQSRIAVASSLTLTAYSTVVVYLDLSHTTTTLP